MNTKPMKAPIDDHASALVRIAELTQQRNELLAACKYAAQFSDCFIAAVITKRLKAAIAKAEGRAE